MLFVGGQQRTNIINKELYQESRALFNARRLYLWHDLIYRGFRPTGWNCGEHTTVISFKALNTPEEQRAAEKEFNLFKEGYIMSVRAEEPGKKILKALLKTTPASEALIRVYEGDIKKELQAGADPEMVLKRYTKFINDMYRENR